MFHLISAKLLMLGPRAHEQTFKKLQIEIIMAGNFTVYLLLSYTQNKGLKLSRPETNNNY